MYQYSRHCMPCTGLSIHIAVFRNSPQIWEPATRRWFIDYTNCHWYFYIKFSIEIGSVPMSPWRLYESLLLVRFVAYLLVKEYQSMIQWVLITQFVVGSFEFENSRIENNIVHGSAIILFPGRDTNSSSWKIHSEQPVAVPLVITTYNGLLQCDYFIICYSAMMSVTWLNWFVCMSVCVWARCGFWAYQIVEFGVGDFWIMARRIGIWWMEIDNNQ